MSATIKYQHVNDHLEKYLLWHQLSIEQKANVICNSLVKNLVAKAIRLGMRREGKQTLPSKDEAVFVNNNKVTRDLGKAVRCEVREEQARDHLTFKEGWTSKQFDDVDLDPLHNAMGNMPDGYKTWLFKQHA